LWEIRPVGEGNWEAPGLQGRAVGGDQACRGEQLGVTRLAEEGSRGDQACREGQLRGTQACRGEQLRVTRPAGEGS
jgi:hypothetical protein